MFDRDRKPERDRRTSEEKERDFKEREQREENGVEHASRDSFPASDPPAHSNPHR